MVTYSVKLNKQHRNQKLWYKWFESRYFIQEGRRASEL